MGRELTTILVKGRRSSKGIVEVLEGNGFKEHDNGIREVKKYTDRNFFVCINSGLDSPVIRDYSDNGSSTPNLKEEFNIEFNHMMKLSNYFGERGLYEKTITIAKEIRARRYGTVVVLDDFPDGFAIYDSRLNVQTDNS